VWRRSRPHTTAPRVVKGTQSVGGGSLSASGSFCAGYGRSDYPA
jgi:hypothetical protein